MVIIRVFQRNHFFMVFNGFLTPQMWVKIQFLFLSNRFLISEFSHFQKFAIQSKIRIKLSMLAGIKIYIRIIHHSNITSYLLTLKDIWALPFLLFTYIQTSQHLYLLKTELRTELLAKNSSRILQTNEPIQNLKF